MAITYMVYSFNLTKISNTTGVVNRQFMGLCEFATMLCGVLAFVCFLNAFPARKKPVIPMVILLYLMLGISIFCDVVYLNQIAEGLKIIEITAARAFIPQAQSMLTAHIVMLVITVVLILTIPVYGKLLKKINTSVQLAENQDIGNIELSE